MALLDPSSPLAPKYWRQETGGLLATAVERYLNDITLTHDDVRLLRLYFEQWIQSPVWDQNPHASEQAKAKLDQLRFAVSLIRTRGDVDAWLEHATAHGLDPL